MGKVYTWSGDDLLPMPDVVESADLCTISGGVSLDPSQPPEFIASDTEGRIYLWSGTNLVPYPSELNEVNICLVSGDVGGYIALDDNGIVYTWQGSELIPVPAELSDKNICMVSVNLIVSGPFSALDDQGNVYIWSDPSELFLVPSEVQTANICWLNSSSPFIIAIDNEGRVYTWQAGEVELIQVPESVHNSVICRGFSSYNFQIETDIGKYAAIDITGNLHVWGITTEGELGSILPYPMALDEGVCSLYNSINLIATDKNMTVITWTYLPDSSVEILSQPDILSKLKICSVSGGLAIDSQYPSGFIALTCSTCPDDIIIMSNTPTTVDLSTISVENSCYSNINLILQDGTVVDESYLFPIGTTMVLVKGNRNCSDCNCAGCIDCASCSFNVSIIPNIVPPIPPVIPIEDNQSTLYQNISVTKTYDYTISSSFTQLNIISEISE